MKSAANIISLAPDDPRKRFGLVIHEVARLRRVAVDRWLRSTGITRAQGYVLAFLMVRDGMSQTALAEDLDMTRVAISGLLSRMESMGLVVRRDDEVDARVRRVYLTKSGAQAARKILKMVDLFDKELLGSESVPDLEVTLRTLLRIKKRLLRMMSAEGPELEDEDLEA
jgi:DNA-binding MarR family transcriptional regulator